MLSTNSMKAGGADDADFFLHVGAAKHPAQAAPQRLLGEDVRLRAIGAQAHDRRDVLHVPTLAQHHHRDDRLVGIFRRVDLPALGPQFLQLFLSLCGCSFGNVAVLLGVDDECPTRKLAIGLLQMVGDRIAIPRVVGHHEHHRLPADPRQFVERLLPFEIAEMQIVPIALDKL